jgi:glycosyltransferase involved in cell wall biosynthesis
MTEPERVAVIVPNYNKAKTLRACLESVYAQRHRPAEVVVVDDASTDGSLEIARSFPCTLVELPGNRGPAAARNTGVAASTAPLLFFVDSDSALAPDAVGNAVRVLRENPDCGIVQGNYDLEPLFDDGPVEAYKVAFEHFWRGRTVGGETGTLFSVCLVRREAYEAAGGMDEDLRNGEDVEFGTRMPDRYTVVVSDAVRTRHDDDHRLFPLLWEQLVRSANAPMVMLKTHRRRRSGATGSRVDMLSLGRLTYLDRTAYLSFGLMGLSLAVLPFAVLMPWLLLVLLGLQATFVVVSHEFLRFALRRKGIRFALVATGMHIATHGAMALGASLGTLRATYEVVRGRFRPTRTRAPAGVPE